MNADRLDQGRLHTPRSKWTVWLWALAWLALQPVASWVYFATNLRRGAYPPEADSIIIGQISAVAGWFITLPLFLGFFWLCFRDYPGRVSWLCFSRARLVWATVWTVLLLALIGLELWSLAGSLAEWFPLDVFSDALAVYLLLCCRSALMHSKWGQSPASPANQAAQP